MSSQHEVTEKKEYPKYPPRNYTPKEIASMTEGYFPVSENYWESIPRGAHIRYIKFQVQGENLSEGERFKTGGYVLSNPVEVENPDGSKSKAFYLSTAPPGSHNYKGSPPPKSFKVRYETVQMLWKKIDPAAGIEIHLASNSIAALNEQVKTLKEENENLNAKLLKVAGRFAELETRLKLLEQKSGPLYNPIKR